MAFLAAAAPILGLIGTGVGAAGTLASGLYAGQVASNNAKVDKQNADYAIAAGEVQAGDQGIKNAEREAKVKNAQAANGIDVNTGSAVDVQASQKMTDTLDIDRILHEAGLRATGYQTQAVNDEAQAGQDVLQGITGSAATLLEKAPTFNLGSGTQSNSWRTARNTVFS